MNEQRESLLKEWARLAPEECWEQGAWWCVRSRFVYPLATNAFGQNQEGNWKGCACLLSALIDAIRARGDWYLDIEISGAEVGAEIKRGILPADEPHTATEPCDAVLACYVQALAATEKP